MTALTLDGTSCQFGGLRAVKDVSFSVPAGTITGLIGPNGAGKTTVVNLISGFLKLSGGRICIGDIDISRAEAHRIARAGIARTFQNIRLIGDASVLDNVVSGFHQYEQSGLWTNLLNVRAVLRERRELEKRALALLDRFGMAGFASYAARNLSYGHQRRLEIIRALALQPRVLLLDEPVAGMNDTEAHSLGAVLREICDQGTAILLIEHNMRFVMSLCSHIYVLAAGELIAQGSPAEIRRDPAVVTAYLGE